MHRSHSTLTIDWTAPGLEEERWEFSHHPAKQPFYLRHAITWEQLETGFAAGCLTAWPRGPELEGMTVEGAYSSYDDYLHYLSRAKRGYRKNYSRMEDDLQMAGQLTLPAPIVLACGGEALLFSGWRRLCLVWNYGMVPYVWLLKLPEVRP